MTSIQGVTAVGDYHDPWIYARVPPPFSITPTDRIVPKTVAFKYLRTDKPHPVNALEGSRFHNFDQEPGIAEHQKLHSHQQRTGDTDAIHYSIMHPENGLYLDSLVGHSIKHLRPVNDPRLDKAA